jgi:Tol biopolymer transport system component
MSRPADPRFVRCLVALVATAVVVALPAAGTAGTGRFAFGDTFPQWSPNGTQIVFTTTRLPSPGGVGVVALANGHEQLVPGIPDGVRSPNWKYVAYTVADYAGSELAVSKVDGSDEQRFDPDPLGFSWAPDAVHLAVGTPNGIDVIGVDGSASSIVPTAGRTSWPIWSPDQLHIAYLNGASPNLHVIDLGTGRDVIISTHARAPGTAAWSPDGSELAFWNRVPGQTLLTVFSLVGYTVTARIPDRYTGSISWSRDGRALFVPSRHGAQMIDLASRKRHMLVGIDDPVLSPDGSLLAYSAEGACPGRLGIYVANVRGTDRRRLTNLCRTP